MSCVEEENGLEHSQIVKVCYNNILTDYILILF